MEDLTNGLTVANVTGAVYKTSRLALNDANVKAKELTALIQKLLSVGIYQSIADAVKAGVPAGTLVIIDDPKTPELEFEVKVV